MVLDKECVAMLLAGGEGRRLGFLTRELAKPAIPFGGKYRIIDFTLSNCTNSGIYTVGVLTQYKPLILNSHIGIGIPWDLDRKEGGVTILPPFAQEKGGKWYRGTANAIYQNLFFIEQHNPRYVLIVSGDHIYKMDYSLMLKYHQEKGADVTIAVIEVPWQEVHRFGVMDVGEDGRIITFSEKPKTPPSNLASMGVYLFNRKLLQKYLQKDEENPLSRNDFGRDVIPLMLHEGCRMFAYPFHGYWRDVGTIESLWEANMDLLAAEPALDIYDHNWRIYTVNPSQPPHFLAATARVEQSLINEGCIIHGTVQRSVLFTGVRVGEGSLIEESIIMPYVRIGRNVQIKRAIIDENTVIRDGCRIFSRSDTEPPQIILVEKSMIIQENTEISM
ncbi:MAG: glucose-1-phosphate adenylyltransferase [Bacillota bacterium]